MKTTTVLLASALVLTCAGGTGVAAATKAPVKKVCKIVVDAAGDAAYAGEVPGDKGDDILSGDVASDGKTLTAVLRLADLQSPNSSAPLGQQFSMEFSVKGYDALLFLAARSYPTGPKFVYGYSAKDAVLPLTVSYPLGDAKGVIDTAKEEVRISAPTSGFSGAKVKIVKGSKLTALTAKTYRILGQGLVPSQNVGPARVPLGGLSTPFDDATGSSYVVGTPSCVKPGA